MSFTFQRSKPVLVDFTGFYRVLPGFQFSFFVVE